MVHNQEDALIGSPSAGTRSRALMGSYSFMSPEQKKGLAVDHRTDLYSMGLMTFLMLTGHDRPTFRPPSQMVEGISVGWDNWLQRALEEDPAERFSSANEMLQAFLAFSELGLDKQAAFSPAASPSVSTSVNEPFPVASESSESPMDFAQPQRVYKDGKPKGKLYLALTITCLVVVGLAIYLVNQSDDESSRSATSRSKTPPDVVTASDVEESPLVPKTTWRDLHAEQFANKPALVAQLARRRKAMIARMVEAEGDFFNEQVVDAMSTIPMELFCPAEQIDFVYGDRPIPIGYEESISQPSLTAFMLTVLDIKKGDKILELKTASGYQTALLAYVGAEVYSLETDLALGRVMSPTLNNLGFHNLHYVVGGDAYAGLPKNGPYDKIIATAAYPSLPRVLFEQLKSGGRIIAPVGDPSVGQSLMLYTKTLDGELKQLELLPVAFSPMPR
jgi:protein-L-isoaspartate(D-aspartate) O-methyltransferase